MLLAPGTRGEPFGQGVGIAISVEVNWAAGVDIDQHGAIPPSPQQCEVNDAEDPHRAGHQIRRSPDQPQHAAATGHQPEPIGPEHPPDQPPRARCLPCLRTSGLHQARLLVSPGICSTYARTRPIRVARARAAVAGASLDDEFVSERAGTRFQLRWLFLHTIEENARHNCHVDFLRERIDGAIGE